MSESTKGNRNLPPHPSARWLEQAIASRRSVLKGAGAAGLAAFGLGGATAAPRPAVAAPVLQPEAARVARRLLQEGKDSATVAVEAAKALDPKPEVLNVVWEDALQLEDPKNFSGPKWEELTGIKINPIGKPFTELFPSQIAEHLGATGAFDVITMVPAWSPDFIAQGVVAPLDPYIDQYMNKADLDDYHPLYKSLMNYGGKVYGLFDDGDVIILYYRTDLFGDQQHQDAYKAKTGNDLAPPQTWDDYDAIQAYFTEVGGGQTYGGASQRAPGQVYGWFTEEFRNRGGRFFDEASMDALLASDPGVATVTAMVNRNKTMPPGVETWGFMEVLTAWMSGQLAMIGGTWPPIGRWSEGTTAEQLNWVPQTQVAGKVGYSIMPLGHSLHNSGFQLAVSADSPSKDAAYLFCQWMTSPEISLQRVMLPYALRDPYRLSHYASEEYRARWATAPVYLDTLKAAADTALVDLTMPGAAEYNTAMDNAVTAAQASTPADQAMKDGAAAMDAITDRIGRDKQKAAYAEFLKLKGSYYS